MGFKRKILYNPLIVMGPEIAPVNDLEKTVT